MLLQLLWVVLEEQTDWENYPLDDLIDEVQAFDGIERDTLLHALYIFVDAMQTNFAVYMVPIHEVKKRLAKVQIFGEAVLLEFVPHPDDVKPKPPPPRYMHAGYRNWLEEVMM